MPAPYTALFTSRKSPISRVSSIDPVGILNAWMRKVRISRNRTNATAIDLVHSQATRLNDGFSTGRRGGALRTGAGFGRGDDIISPRLPTRSAFQRRSRAHDPR